LFIIRQHGIIAVEPCLRGIIKNYYFWSEYRSYNFR